MRRRDFLRGTLSLMMAAAAGLAPKQLEKDNQVVDEDLETSGLPDIEFIPILTLVWKEDGTGVWERRDSRDFLGGDGKWELAEIPGGEFVVHHFTEEVG